MDIKIPEQTQAKYLFSQTDLSQNEIAAQLGINRKTLYNWIKEGDWFRCRSAAAHAPCMLVEQYYNQLFAINEKIASREDACPTDKEAMTIKRITGTIKQLNTRQFGSEAIETLSFFMDHFRQRNPRLASSCSSYMENYIEQRLKKPDVIAHRIKRSKEEDLFDQEYTDWLNTQPSDETSYIHAACQENASSSPVRAQSDSDGCSPSAPAYTPHTAQNGVTPPAIENPLEPLTTADYIPNNYAVYPTENNENGVTCPELYSFADNPAIHDLLAVYDDPNVPNPPPYTPPGLSSEEYFRVEIEMRKILNALPDEPPQPPTPMGQLLVSPPITERFRAA